jgi:Yip1 domain
MSELSPAVDEVTVSNPFARIVTVIIAPSKAFADVKKSPGWWAPFLLASVVGLIYAYVLLHGVGLATLVDQTIHQSSRLESQIASATPEAAAKIRHQIEFNFKFAYVAPVISLVAGLICAGILLATANFGAGGRSTYGQMLGVWFYGSLPLTVYTLLIIAGVYAGAASDPFNINNAIGTNPGFYLTDSELPKPLIALLSSIDIFSIWTAALLAIGISTVAGVKRGAAWAIVLGWWLIYVLLLKVTPAAFG